MKEFFFSFFQARKTNLFRERRDNQSFFSFSFLLTRVKGRLYKARMKVMIITWKGLKFRKKKAQRIQAIKKLVFIVVVL